MCSYWEYHLQDLTISDRKEMMLIVATKKLKQGPALRSLEIYFYFLSNNYLGLSSHPTVSKAAAKAALAYGMGPRGSALICGYTSYHGLLESCLADLKKKEVQVMCYLQGISLEGLRVEDSS